MIGDQKVNVTADQVLASQVTALFRINNVLETRFVEAKVKDIHKTQMYLKTVTECNCYACRCAHFSGDGLPDIV